MEAQSTTSKDYREAVQRIAECKERGATAIKLNGLKLVDLPTSLFKLRDLQELELESLSLQSITSRISQLKALKSLNLFLNWLQYLPPEIGALPNLQTLILTCNRLETLPPEIGLCRALIKLDVSDNNLQSVPPEIGQLKALKSLSLRNNQISILPPEIGKLSTLEMLDLGGNKLKSLPVEIVKFNSLETLDLGGNKFQIMQPEILELTALKKLEMDNNQLHLLPPEIVGLKALHTLDLRNNKIHSLPPIVGQLKTLQTLDLSNNGLESLPPEIGQLRNLTKLALNLNKLKYLPPEIVQLKTDLILSQNPLEEPPLQVVTGGIYAVRTYFDLKDRPDAIVDRSSQASVLLNRPSRLALWETSIAAVLALTLIASGWGTFVWSWLVFSPLFLLRTKKSISTGLTAYGWLVRQLRIRSTRTPWLLPARLILLGVGSLLIKFGVTLWYGWRSLPAIPENYRHITRCVDRYSPPELVAGAEAAHGSDRDNIFVLDELSRAFTENTDSIFYRHSSYRPWQASIGAALLWLFFAFTWIYRWSIKATAFVYFPFLLFYRFNDEAMERVYAAKESTFSLQKGFVSMTMGGLFLVSMNGLAEINQSILLQDIIGTIPDDNWFKNIFHIFTPWIDKAIFTCLLFVSSFYLASRVFLLGLGHALGQYNEGQRAVAIATQDAPNRWFKLVKFCWAGLNISASAFVIVMLTVALPHYDSVAIFVWNFLF